MRKKYLLNKRLVAIAILVMFFVVAFQMNAVAEEPQGSAPIADAGGPYVGQEGIEMEFDASGSSDPDGDPLYYRWSFDGVWTSWSPNPVTQHAWYDDYVGVVELQVADFDFVSSDTADVTVNNVEPTVFFEFGYFTQGYINNEMTLSGSFYDPDQRSFSDDTHIAEFDWGDGSSSTVTDDGDFIVSDTHTYTEVGVYQFTLTVTDDDGGVGSANCLVVITGVDAGDDITINEGDVFSRTGSFLFMNALSFIGTADYGDRFPLESLVISGSPPDPCTFDLNHQYLDDGTYSLVVNIIDASENQVLGSDTVLVTVNNIAPDILSIDGLPSDPIAVGNEISLTSVFTDPGILDAHTAVIDWGDGTTSNGVINDLTVTDSHSYSEAGVFTVTVTVEDDDGGIDTEIFQYVVAYDPDAGFVTGGGWVNSPAGAYVIDPTLEGKATFGFISKYKKRQSTPSGNTEFQFHAASLNFHSKDYDWLVIAGSKAMYKGTGTINGNGNFGFMISAVDGKLKGGDVDTFRIKIWDKDTDNLIYDNNVGNDENDDPTTALDGGQIVIHKK